MHACIYIRVCDTGDEKQPLSVDRALIMVEVRVCVWGCVFGSACHTGDENWPLSDT